MEKYPLRSLLVLSLTPDIFYGTVGALVGKIFLSHHRQLDDDSIKVWDQI